MTQDSGVEGGTPWVLRRSTNFRRSTLGHNNDSPDALCLTFPPLRTFFWVVNISVTKFAAWRFPSVAVVAKELQLQMKALSSRRKAVLSDLDPMYSLVHISKK